MAQNRRLGIAGTILGVVGLLLGVGVWIALLRSGIKPWSPPPKAPPSEM